MPKLKKKSQETRSDRMKIRRLDESLYDRDRMSNINSHRKQRLNKDNRAFEQHKNSQAHRESRLEETRRFNEQKLNTEARRHVRMEEGRRSLEQYRNTEEHRKARLDVNTRSLEQEKNTIAHSKARLDTNRRTLEQERNTEERSIARQDPNIRSLEQERNTEERSIARQDPNIRSLEQERNTEERSIARQDPNIRSLEQERNSKEHKRARLDDNRRSLEQERNTEEHVKARRDTNRKSLEQERNTQDRRHLREQESSRNEFINAIKLGPVIPCFSCDGLFFKSSTKPLHLDKLLLKYGHQFCNEVLRSTKTKDAQLCSTCHLHINLGKVPKLSFSNGLVFPDVPEALKGMTQLEERLVAARIPFMCITKLGVDRQCGLKGNVINIINPINQTAKILPRQFDDESILPLKLMRRMEYNNPYLFETIGPLKVFNAAKYLAATDLYSEEGVILSEDWLLNKVNNPENSTKVILKDRIQDELHDGLNPGGQQTLLIDFDALENNEAIRFAPGEGQRPVSLLLDLNAETLSFPTIYCGMKRILKNNRITRTDIAKSEARNKDRRCALPSKLLYSFKLVQTHQIASQIQLCLRKKKGKGKPTAANLINNDFVENLLQHDDAYKVLKQTRTSPAYWEDKQKVLMAMIRQLGIPSLFITLSAAEIKWPELIVILKNVLDGHIINEKEAEDLPWSTKADLIRRDPITCSRYFDYRLRQCNKFILLHTNGIFRDHPIQDFFTRIEFQHRGSPHMHGLYWLKGAPKYEEDDPESVNSCKEFIDKYIACDSNVSGVIHQRHKHTSCCEVKYRGELKCRFGMPYPPMPSTRILLPFPTEFPANTKRNAQNNLRMLKDQVQYLLAEKIYLEFDDLLDYLGIDEKQYIMAVRSGINRPTVFLQRNIKDAFINAFNPELASLWKANMDMQFILDPYACCKYCVAYVSKSCRGMSKLLREVIEEVKTGNLTCKERLKKFSHVFLNCREVSAQEAAYSVLSIPLSRCSRDCTYIDTGLPDERVYLTKSADELKNLSPNSTDVNVAGLHDHYVNRPSELDMCTLAEFAAWWTFSKRKNSKFGKNDNISGDESDEDDISTVSKWHRLNNESGYIRKRLKARIIRFRNYGKIQDEANYYRENVMLYTPWRDEAVDILQKDCKELYNDNLLKIEMVKLEFDRRLDTRLMEEHIAQVIAEEDQEEYIVDNEYQIMHEPDLEGNFGLELGEEVERKAQKIQMPKIVDDLSYHELISNLNHKQSKYHNHVVSNVTFKKEPFYEYVAGGAGVGKSMLITAITQSILRKAVNVIGEDPTRLKVLLCASTGVAAFNIGGVTLHQAFGLPFTQFDGVMPRLREATRNRFASQFQDLDIIIIDEISMTSREQLFQIDDRLRQIFKSSDDFGGKSILTVGDFQQLEPVMASWIFSEPTKGLQALGSNYLWPKFKFFELTECMRQRNDLKFAEALNRLAKGICTEEDTLMFKSREIRTNGLVPPDSAIVLNYGNQDVDVHNNRALANLNTEGITSYANDRVQGTGKTEHYSAIREAAKKLPTKKAQNLPLEVHFKINAKYMMTINVDTSDGLVNGAIGILRKIVYGRTCNGARVPLKVVMEFPKNVGGKLKKKPRNFNGNEDLLKNCVPVGKENRVIHRWPGRNLEVVRIQFAFIPAESITIHKSQGSTFNNVVVNVQYSTKSGGSRKIPRRALYVGFSRCTSLSGLFIEGQFEPPAPPGENDPVEIEMQKLRKRPVVFQEIKIYSPEMEVEKNTDASLGDQNLWDIIH